MYGGWRITFHPSFVSVYFYMRMGVCCHVEEGFQQRFCEIEIS
jgi:hypothetical protein